MSAKDEEKFQSRNKCWICNKLIHVGYNNKIRYHDHITGKYRGSECHYDTHLIIQENVKFDIKISVIPNGLE